MSRVSSIGLRRGEAAKHSAYCKSEMSESYLWETGAIELLSMGAEIEFLDACNSVGSVRIGSQNRLAHKGRRHRSRGGRGQQPAEEAGGRGGGCTCPHT